ncbi:MAG: hypothetical protein ACT4OK_11030 [Gemmobacter sp.]
MALKSSEITESETLRILVQVTKDDGSPKPLAGASYAAVMGKVGNQRLGAVTVIDATRGLVQAAFPAATGMAGQVVASLHVTINGETQCVWRERFQVFPDLEPL